MTALASLSYVYDGRRCLGHIIARGKTGFEAFDADDKSVGLFPSQRAAADALTQARGHAMNIDKKSPATWTGQTGIKRNEICSSAPRSAQAKL
jgi:hypothetical protein